MKVIIYLINNLIFIEYLALLTNIGFIRLIYHYIYWHPNSSPTTHFVEKTSDLGGEGASLGRY